MLAVLIFSFSQVAFSENNYRQPGNLINIMRAVADVYGERLNEEKVSGFGHEEFIRPLEAADLPSLVYQALTELFVVVEQDGVVWNGVDFAALKNQMNIRTLEPVVVENSLESPKIFEVLSGGKVVGYAIERPSSNSQGAEVRTLYITRQGGLVRDGLGTIVRKKRTVRAPFDIYGLNTLLGNVSVKSCSALLN